MTPRSGFLCCTDCTCDFAFEADEDRSASGPAAAAAGSAASDTAVREGATAGEVGPWDSCSKFGKTNSCREA